MLGGFVAVLVNLRGTVVVYLCVCSLSVGSGRVIFVSEKSLKLCNAAAHS